MQLQIKLTDSQAYSHALFKLNLSSIENATRYQHYKLLNNRFDHERSQDNSENNDENAVQSDKNTHSLTCNHREQI